MASHTLPGLSPAQIPAFGLMIRGTPRRDLPTKPVGKDPLPIPLTAEKLMTRTLFQIEVNARQ